MALTGVAGPTEQDGQPVGVVWIAISGAMGEAGAPDVMTRKLQLGGDRDQIRQISTISALDLLRRRLLDG
jgi:nicotinamide mononucleotide (NMN) deamidase PncC